MNVVELMWWFVCGTILSATQPLVSEHSVELDATSPNMCGAAMQFVAAVVITKDESKRGGTECNRYNIFYMSPCGCTWETTTRWDIWNVAKGVFTEYDTSVRMWSNYCVCVGLVDTM